jgi:hypothetical protein
VLVLTYGVYRRDFDSERERKHLADAIQRSQASIEDSFDETRDRIIETGITETRRAERRILDAIEVIALALLQERGEKEPDQSD